MSQEQPQRQQQGSQQTEPIKYGDVFQVTGDLASKPIAPQDAVVMQAAEGAVFGQVHPGGPAAAMQTAASINLAAGLVGPTSDVTGLQGITVTDVPATRIYSETVAGQVVAEYVQPIPVGRTEQGAEGGGDQQQGGGSRRKSRDWGGDKDEDMGDVDTNITIGEALEVTGRVSGDRPVERSDAAAIRAAEARTAEFTTAGLGAAAQAAAAFNEGVDGDDDKLTLGDLLSGATMVLPRDKAVTRSDAEAVATEELKNDPNLRTKPGGIAASLATAARLNEEDAT